MRDHIDRELYRGRVAWHMPLEDVLIGHNPFAFNYPMSGDDRPDVRSRVREEPAQAGGQDG